MAVDTFVGVTKGDLDPLTSTDWTCVKSVEVTSLMDDRTGRPGERGSVPQGLFQNFLRAESGETPLTSSTVGWVEREENVHCHFEGDYF